MNSPAADTPILALDPATLTGYCHGLGKKYFSGTWNIQAPGHFGNKLRQFYGFLCDFHESRPFARIAIEDAMQGSRARATMAFHSYLRGMVYFFAAEHGNLPVAMVNPMTLKKFACNDGKAKKADVIRACRMHGFTPEDDNEADAIMICLMAQQDYEIEQRTTRHRSRRSAPKPRTLFEE